MCTIMDAEIICPYLYHDKCIREEVVLWCSFERAHGEPAVLDHGEGEVVTGQHQAAPFKPKSRLKKRYEKWMMYHICSIPPWVAGLLRCQLFYFL